MTSFNKAIVDRGLERIRLEVNDNGILDAEYGHGASLCIRKGWNEGCEMIRNTLSLNELRDLKYLIELALEQRK